MVASVESDFDDETLGPRELNGAPVDPCFGWCLTYPANSIDCPAISVPVGLAEEGPSVVIRLIVPRFKDTTVLALPQQLNEEASGLTLPSGCGRVSMAGTPARATGRPANSVTAARGARR
jgi:hypothetical protein